MFWRQIYFQPKADNFFKQLQKGINLLKENEIQDRLNKLSSLSFDKFGKTTNIQDVIIYTVESLVWQIVK